MKRNTYRLRTEFGPDSRFEVPASPPAPFRSNTITEFEKLQRVLLQNLLHSTDDANLNLLYRHAVIEAAALAAATEYPALVLPVLLNEKAEVARGYARQQAQIRARGRMNEETRVA